LRKSSEGATGEKKKGGKAPRDDLKKTYLQFTGGLLGGGNNTYPLGGRWKGRNRSYISGGKKAGRKGPNPGKVETEVK